MLAVTYVRCLGLDRLEGEDRDEGWEVSGATRLGVEGTKSDGEEMEGGGGKTDRDGEIGITQSRETRGGVVGEEVGVEAEASEEGGMVA